MASSIIFQMSVNVERFSGFSDTQGHLDQTPTLHSDPDLCLIPYEQHAVDNGWRQESDNGCSWAKTQGRAAM